MQTPRTEFAQALRAIAQERGLDPEVILDTIRQAIIAAYKRDARERGEEVDEFAFDVELDPTNGEAKVFAWPSPGEDATDEEREKAEKDATEKGAKKDVTPPGFGRIAAQTAKQVIHQKIREAEKGAIMDEFTGRIGSLITGMILRFDGSDVRVDLGRTEGLMPKEERVPSERLNPNQRLSFLLKEIKDTPKGKQVILSRADSEFVKKLFGREVPEMSSGSVEVKAIAREAGVRTKMAVFSNQSGVDPVGSCVGQKGVRVQAVTNELGGERVDIIQHTDNLADLVKASLSPAEGLSVKLDLKTKIATVKAPEDQLSLAIGKDGQNARLAAKLTGVKIEIKGIPVEEKNISEGTEEVTKGTEKMQPESELVKVEKKEVVIDDSAKTKGKKVSRVKKVKNEKPKAEEKPDESKSEEGKVKTDEEK